jgi:hypothetical protein
MTLVLTARQRQEALQVPRCWNRTPSNGRTAVDRGCDRSGRPVTEATPATRSAPIGASAASGRSSPSALTSRAGVPASIDWPTASATGSSAGSTASRSMDHRFCPEGAGSQRGQHAAIDMQPTPRGGDYRYAMFACCSERVITRMTLLR